MPNPQGDSPGTDRVYVCGPMRGLSEHNFPAFRAAALLLRARGWIVVSPVEVGMMFDNDPAIHGSEYVREDLMHLARCHAIALLPGWEASVGARCEVAVALTLGLRFFDAVTAVGIEAPRRVVVNGGYEQAPEVTAFDLVLHLERQRVFSESTFGPGCRVAGVLDHIRKELAEIERDPADLSEWIDVVLLALDGAWRQGHSSEAIVTALAAKQDRNERRRWPDWRTAPKDRAIEHERLEGASRNEL